MPSLPPTGGVGTELIKLTGAYGLSEKPGCGCKEKAARMDAWGVVGCQTHRKEIIGWMHEGYNGTTWEERGKAAVKSFGKVNPFDAFNSILNDAIGRAIENGNEWPPLRIAFQSPSLLLGGAERWIASLCKHFDTKKVWPIAVVLEEIKDVSPIAKAWLPSHVQIVDVAHTAKVLKHADVYITWGTKDFSRCAGVRPIVDVQHGTAGFGSTQYNLAKAAVAAGAHLTAVGEACLANFDKDVAGKVTVIENGADTDRLMPGVPRDAARAQLGIGPNEKMVLFIGRFAPVKNLAGLAAAVAALPHNWRLVAVGPQYQPVPAIAALGARATVLPPQEFLGNLLAAADVFCAPSHHEANSLAVMEAWLAGVPTVTTAYPAALAMETRHGPMSWLVPINPSPTVLAQAILTADFESDGRRSYCRADYAQLVARQHYTAVAMARRWEAYLMQEFRK